MSNKEVVKKFLEDATGLINEGNSRDAAHLLTDIKFVKPLQNWTVEIERLHSDPIDGEEEILAKKLDIVLLEIADNISETLIGGDSVNFGLVVLCLNKLGKNAPKRLVEKMQRHWKEYKTDPGRQGEMGRLAHFLPIV